MAEMNWISVFHHGRQDEKENKTDISWESSDSDPESFISKNRRPRKLYEVNSFSKPRSSFLTKCSIISSKNDDASSKNHGNNSVESPIIGLNQLDFYKLSPDLSQQNRYFFFREPSPVIEKRRTRVKNKKREKESYSNDTLSPDLFVFEGTQDIDNESPTLGVFSTQATVTIEPFPSQLSSQVVSTDLGNVSLYFEPPKRRKNYKKDGLADQLNKTLKLKKSRTKIWHHEKTNNIDSELKEDTEKVVKFKIRYCFREYGNVVLECNPQTSKNSNDNNGNNIFLIIVGVNSILNVEWENNSIYELYPPYKINTVQYKNRDKNVCVLCYNNVAKFLKCHKI